MKLKRSIINVIVQIVYFQKALNVCDMEYFMYPSMFRQFNVYSIVEAPGRMYLPGTLELPTFISKLLIFVAHTLAYKKSSRKLLICKFLGFSAKILTFIYLMTVFACDI